MADYEKINWKNGREGGTATSAANFGHMEDGIDAATKAAAEAKSTADGKAADGHQHEAQDITDSSAFSRGLIRTEDAAGARAHLQAAAADAIPDVSGFVTQSDIDSAVEGLASTGDIPDVSGLASQSALEALESRIAALESADDGDGGE